MMPALSVRSFNPTLAFDRRPAFDRAAYDRKAAYDRASVRSFDADGRLHVSVANVSKACVSKYHAEEIPRWRELGLVEGRVYRLLRDPDELRKSVRTFDNLPILSKHVAVTAVDHRPEIVVGATGSDAEFEDPYLTNSLVIWAASAIRAIKDGTRAELSSGYRYSPIMEPGTFEGEAFDGRMTNIVGSHVALVSEGRAGPDVVVGDSTPWRRVMATASRADARLAHWGAFWL